MVRIKICGITSIDDAHAAVRCGADALGFILYPGSKRYIEPSAARSIITTLPPFVTTVGVFVNQSEGEIIEARDTAGFDLAQLHGDESPELAESLPMGVIKALRVGEGFTPSDARMYDCVRAVLFDTLSPEARGGTGRTFDWSVLAGVPPGTRVILSGGLDATNVAGAIGRVHPYGVDVSSGVEKSPGIKDHKKIEEFIEACRNEH